jgi:preprotein translocase subunit SecA
MAMWRCAVPGQLMPLKVGGIEVLVETVPVAGSEPTSRLSRAGEKVQDAFERAQEAIIEVAASTVESITSAADRAGYPSKVELELGIKFDVRGDVVIASSSAGASLLVRLSYNLPGGPVAAAGMPTGR